MKGLQLSAGSSAVLGHARERGVILFIALIVLVAMTLAGIGMIRAVDTVNVVAGNLGFKQASINAADRGVEAAFHWLLDNAGTAALISDDLGNGYSSSAPVQEPDWNDPASWDNAVTTNGGAADNAGNKVSYVINRMCMYPGVAVGGTNGVMPQQCATASTTISNSTCSRKSTVTCFTTTPSLYYRITTRIEGPRNTVSYIQVMVLITS